MKKTILKKFKRLLALVLIIILNTSAYATMSYHDGSAFVTKAEFDSLMENFTSQKKQYKAELNKKIDDAVSAYIAGLSGVTHGSTEVGYFAILPSNITTVNMASYNSYSFSFGYPKLTAIYNAISSFSDAKHHCSRQLVYSYNPSTTGSRRTVSYDNGKYRFDGYMTGYVESHNLNWLLATSNSLGYSNVKVGVVGTTVFSRSSTSTGDYWTNFIWYTGDTSGAATSPQSPNFAVNNTTYSYSSISYKYDLIYSDYPTSSQSANNMRLFLYGNRFNRWWAGGGYTYGTFLNNCSVSVTSYSTNNGSKYNTFSYYSKVTDQMSSYTGQYMYSAGFEPISNWASVYTNDTTNYVYGPRAVGSSKTTFQNYSMIAGAAFCAVNKDCEYTWKVEFNDTADSTIWLRYDKFNGAPVDSECIKVSVDGGSLANKGTIKAGKGTVKFKATKDGFLFLKWSEGKRIKVEPSRKISIDYPVER